MKWSDLVWHVHVGSCYMHSPLKIVMYMYTLKSEIWILSTETRCLKPIDLLTTPWPKGLNFSETFHLFDSYLLLLESHSCVWFISTQTNFALIVELDKQAESQSRKGNKHWKQKITKTLDHTTRCSGTVLFWTSSPSTTITTYIGVLWWSELHEKKSFSFTPWKVQDTRSIWKTRNILDTSIQTERKKIIIF